MIALFVTIDQPTVFEAVVVPDVASNVRSVTIVPPTAGGDQASTAPGTSVDVNVTLETKGVHASHVCDSRAPKLALSGDATSNVTGAPVHYFAVTKKAHNPPASEGAE